MESHPSVTDRPVRIPPIVWFLGLGLIAVLIAIFVFNVALNTVAYYGFFALMIGSHLFMHGSHGGHRECSRSAGGVRASESNRPRPQRRGCGRDRRIPSPGSRVRRNPSRAIWSLRDAS